MGFKDELAADLDETFFSIDELAELHIIDGKEIECIFDDNKLREKQGGADVAITESSALLFVKTSEIGSKKPTGTPMDIDGRPYFVDEWDEDMGMTTVTLHQNVNS